MDQEKNNSIPSSQFDTKSSIKKSVFRRWYFWVGLVLLFPIFMAGYYWYLQIWKATFRGDELAQANTALANGIYIEDPRDDFIILESNDEKPNPEMASPYRLPQLDVKSLQIGADDDYLYYKVTFYAKTDRAVLVVNGDKIHSFGVNFDITEESGRVLAVLHTNTGWWPIIGTSINGTFYSTEPTGIEWPENARFAKEKNNDSKMYGGAGTDFQLARFPLKTLGLSFGQKMVFDLEVEGGSGKYSHAAADPFLGTGKSAGMITWVIGSKEYEIDNNPNPYLSNEDKKDQSSKDESKTDDSTKPDSKEIIDFETCAKVYPVMETYPETCKTSDGKTFTKSQN